MLFHDIEIKKKYCTVTIIIHYLRINHSLSLIYDQKRIRTKLRLHILTFAVEDKKYQEMIYI